MTMRDLTIKRYNRLIGVRNTGMRQALNFIAELDTATVNDLISNLQMTRTTAQKAVQELCERRLLTFTEECGIKGVRKRYSVVAHTEAELDHHLPISTDMAVAAGFYLYTRPPAVVRPELPQVHVGRVVHRDPMDIALMGHGVAPSVLFWRENVAQAGT